MGDRIPIRLQDELNKRQKICIILDSGKSIPLFGHKIDEAIEKVKKIKESGKEVIRLEDQYGNLIQRDQHGNRISF
jgi:hypothetical protein